MQSRTFQHRGSHHCTLAQKFKNFSARKNIDHRAFVMLTVPRYVSAAPLQRNNSACLQKSLSLPWNIAKISWSDTKLIGVFLDSWSKLSKLRWWHPLPPPTGINLVDVDFDFPFPKYNCTEMLFSRDENAIKMMPGVDEIFAVKWNILSPEISGVNIPKGVLHIGYLVQCKPYVQLGEKSTHWVCRHRQMWRVHRWTPDLVDRFPAMGLKDMKGRREIKSDFWGQHSSLPFFQCLHSRNVEISRNKRHLNDDGEGLQTLTNNQPITRMGMRRTPRAKPPKRSRDGLCTWYYNSHIRSLQVQRGGCYQLGWPYDLRW